MGVITYKKILVFGKLFNKNVINFLNEMLEIGSIKQEIISLNVIEFCALVLEQKYLFVIHNSMISIEICCIKTLYCHDLTWHKIIMMKYFFEKTR